jgi:hypothetical protein
VNIVNIFRGRNPIHSPVHQRAALAPFEFVYGPGQRNNDLYVVHSTGEENGGRTFALRLEAAS